MNTKVFQNCDRKKKLNQRETNKNVSTAKCYFLHHYSTQIMYLLTNSGLKNRYTKTKTGSSSNLTVVKFKRFSRLLAVIGGGLYTGA